MNHSWIKSALISIVIFIFSTSQAQAEAEGGLRFENIYKIPIWQNDYMVWGTIFVVSAGAAAFTTMTAGTGAPVAATGVSTIASTLAGGGAGSYMAGLSMVGGWVGGNAIVGAAILNAGSVALIGGTALKTMPPVALVTLQTMKRLGPVLLIPKNEKKEFNFTIAVPPTTSIGTDAIKEIVKRTEQIAKNRDSKLIDAKKEYNELGERAIIFAERQPAVVNDERLEEKVSALLLVRQFGHINEFIRNATNLPERGSFVHYLKSIAYLDKQDYDKAEFHAQQAMIAEKKAIEPILLEIIALNALDNYQKALKLEEDIEKVDEKNHKSAFSKATAFNLLGDYASYQKEYTKAAYFYQKVFDSTSYFDPNEEKALISAKLGNALRLSGDSRQANKFYDKAIDYANSTDKVEDIKNSISKIYNQGYN